VNKEFEKWWEKNEQGQRWESHPKHSAALAWEATCEQKALSPTALLDGQRLDKLAKYLSDYDKNISGPYKDDNSWQFGYNGGQAYVVDAAGGTLRDAIDELPI